MGRRPVRVKVKRLHSRVFDVFGFGAKVDVVAQQVLDHEEGIFKAVKSNDLERALQLIDEDAQCLLVRDSVGATPVHVAFLYGHNDLGKQIVLRRRDLATLTYSTLEMTGELSPYEGENILHVVIAQRHRRLARWLVAHVPELIHAETVGKFFRPSKTCYFGGTPLLFALASNQIVTALDILDAAERLKHLPLLAPKRRATHVAMKKQQQAMREQTTANGKQRVSVKASRVVHAGVETANDAEGEETGDEYETSIFMCDSFGNNALHIAVIHDLPNVFDFAILFAMEALTTGPDKNESYSSGSGSRHLDTANTETSSLVTPVNTANGMTASSVSAEDAAAEAERRRRARVASYSTSNRARESLVDFQRRVDTATYERMTRFLMQRNTDLLTPLSLAAAIGNQRMFQHILQHNTSLAWSYGPITALNIPLRDLDEPELVPHVHYGRFQIVHDALTSLPYPLAPRGQKGFKTAIECLCSYDRLSCTIPKNDPATFRTVLANRLEMLKLLEITQLLHKKWKYVGKKRFLSRLLAYGVFLLAFNVSTLFETAAYNNAAAPLWKRVLLVVCEVISYGFAIVKFMNEAHQLCFNFHSYVTEAGAGRLDNVCTVVASLCLFSAGFARLGNQQELTDAFTAVALVFSWFYLFFFLLGFRSTGPFVIMILTMIQNDIVRFIFVYVAVMAGFSQALYLVHDGRVGIKTLLHRVRMLVIAGFTGEINYDDNYTSGRMNAFTQVLMLGYVILVMILLVNLLIAMMGNTYTEILAESEQRWVAERANIMVTIENQCTAASNRAGRRQYGVPLVARQGCEEELFLQLEMNSMDTWKKEQELENHEEAATLA